MPVVFLIVNLFVSLKLLNMANNIKDDGFLSFLKVIFYPFMILSIIFYLMSAYTNPGYLIGDETV